MTVSSPVNAPELRAALLKLADIVTPRPPGWAPRTWGWAALAVIVSALAAGALLVWRRRREAERYRVEALEELARLEGRVAQGDTAGALTELPVLLKRVALAVWPRAEVASLSEWRWTDFLAARGAHEVPDRLANLLREGEYRAPATLAAQSAEDARARLGEARRWIEAHRVST